MNWRWWWHRQYALCIPLDPCQRSRYSSHIAPWRACRQDAASRSWILYSTTLPQTNKPVFFYQPILLISVHPSIHIVVTLLWCCCTLAANNACRLLTDAETPCHAMPRHIPPLSPWPVCTYIYTTSISPSYSTVMHPARVTPAPAPPSVIPSCCL